MAIQEFISYNASTHVYTISPGANASTIQTVIDNAPAGAVLHFAAGTHTLTAPLTITRDDITLRGEGNDTILQMALETPGSGIIAKGKVDTSWDGVLAENVATHARTIVLQDTQGLKAGDVLMVEQANDAEFLSSSLYDNVINSPYMQTSPLRQSVVEVESVNGSTVTLKHAIAYDMEGGKATVQRLDMLENVEIANLKVAYTLGEADPYQFSNTLPAYDSTSAIELRYTHGVEVKNITIDQPASNGVELRTSLEAHVDGLTVTGAHNKGGGGNGYGLHLSETFYGEFEHLSFYDTRHAVVFSSWHAEAYNTVQVDFTNRDINYHGSDDHSNTVIVNQAVYNGTTTKGWALVSPGSDMHPYTDIAKNTTLFGHAVGSFKDDEVTGWNNGATLYGMGGNDTLRGGAGNDFISGGIGNDVLSGGAGQDKFERTFGHGQDIILDFKAGNDGDVLSLAGYVSLNSFQNLKLVQHDNGTEVVLFRSSDMVDSVLLKGVQATALTAANFTFPTAPANGPESDYLHDGVNTMLSSGDDFIRSGSQNDVVHTWASNLTGADDINLGTGMDTLHIISDNFTFTSASLPRLHGIDVIDVKEAGNAKLYLDSSFLSHTDSSKLTLVYGAGGIARLDTTAVSSNYEILLHGTGKVFLNHDTGNRVIVDDETLGEVHGGRGDDYFRVRDAANDIYGGDGNDYFTVTTTTSADMDGGQGNDIFHLSGDYLGAGASINGGGGVDELLITRAITLDADAMRHVQNVEMLRINTSGTIVETTDNLFSAGTLQVRGNGSLIDATLDVSGLTQTSTLQVERNINLTLNGSHSGGLTVEMLSKANGTLTASNAADAIIGNAYHNTIRAQGGNDTITGGAGNDTLSGGTGGDTFHLHSGDGHDTITDFQAGKGGDIIALTGFYAWRNFSELQGAMVQDGANVRLTLSGNESLRFLNAQVSQFTTDNFTINNSAVKDLTLRTSSSADRLITGAGNDTVQAWISTFTPVDIVDLGSGTDTLMMMSTSYTLDLRTYSTLKGIDVLDVSTATSAPALILSNALLANSDTGSITLRFGAAGIRKLDLSEVDPTREITLEGSGSVYLTDNTDSRLLVNAIDGAHIHGGSGSEYIRLRGGDVLASGNGGNDTFSVTGDGNFTIQGGIGDDIFQFSSSAYMENNTVDGGAGFDEIRLYDTVQLSTEEVAHIRGIERITLYGDDNGLTLTGSMTDGSLELRGKSSGLDATITLQNWESGQTLIIGENLSVVLKEDAAATYRIETTSTANGIVQGGGGMELMTGGQGNDRFFGNAGADTLIGGYGNDLLNGGSGKDILEGGRGNDTLYGGDAGDIFRFTDRRDGGDTIKDFANGDILDLVALFSGSGLHYNASQAVSMGYLKLTQKGDDLYMAYDRDSAAKSNYTAEHLVTLENVSLDNFNINMIETV